MYMCMRVRMLASSGVRSQCAVHNNYYDVFRHRCYMYLVAQLMN